ncbi:SGNH/GDSL hydrolase family protein [Microvirga sp. 3-52]|nr:SGNH/GDSL hydrolase family protein [Microvirga sp. 3-52]
MFLRFFHSFVLAGRAGHPSRLIASSLGVLALCGGLAFWAGTKQSRGLSSETYAEQRLPQINTHLDEVRKGFIFLAGDSHVELFNETYRLCGREIVNGGISGAKSDLYRDLASRLEFHSRPEAIVLTIGTNNLTRKRNPLAPASQNAYERDVSQIVATFRKVAPRVIVTAVPPVSSFKDGFEIPAVAAYSEMLRDLCAREGCEFVDPYDSARERDRSTAQPGTMRDGVHMASYRAVQARLGALLCPVGILEPAPVKAAEALQ